RRRDRTPLGRLSHRNPARADGDRMRIPLARAGPRSFGTGAGEPAARGPAVAPAAADRFRSGAEHELVGRWPDLFLRAGARRPTRRLLQDCHAHADLLTRLTRRGQVTQVRNGGFGPPANVAFTRPSAGPRAPCGSVPNTGRR